jgi:hypothetical protein
MKFQEFISESKKSDQHEKAIAKAFKGQTLPNELPTWMTDYGFMPGAKVVDSRQTGGSGIKPDIVVKFDEGPSLRISAKMSNADFFGNWYPKWKVRADLGDELIKPLSDATLEFVKKFKGRGDPFVGVSISFGKRSGQTAKKFTDLFPVGLIKRVVAGGSPDAEVNANSLYATTDIPNNIGALIERLEPISDSVIRKLSKNFNIIFRPVYTGSNRSNMSKPAWVQVVGKTKFNKPIMFEKQDDLLKNAHWTVTALDKDISHNKIVANLRKFNILVPKP